MNAKLRSFKFSAKNRSLLDTRFQWSTYPEEFQISPSEGILKASNSRKRYKNYLDDFFINIYLNIKIFYLFKSEFDLTFHASNTSLFRGVAECKFGPELEYKKKIKLSAQSSFPQLFIGTLEKMSKR